jgi:hypothetical protein
MHVKSSISILCVLLGTTLFSAMADEPPVPAKKVPPRSPGEYRQDVLREIDRFRELKGPKSISGGDEHIGRGTIRRFQETQFAARLALAYDGNRPAIAELAKEFDLENPKDEQWLQAHLTLAGGVHPNWSEEIFQVMNALEPHRPELARQMRRRMLRLRVVVPNTENFLRSEEPKIQRMSLAELKRAATGEDPSFRRIAMERWARLERENAVPELVKILNNTKLEINPRFDAARALAMVGDERGFDWLKQAIVDNISCGGSPGSALLESGNRGTAIYFQLIADYKKKNPDKDLPYGLLGFSLWGERFFDLLPRFLEIKDKGAVYEVRTSLANMRLPPDTLAFLIDQLKKGNYQDKILATALRDSLSRFGPENAFARQVAELWVDELQNSTAAEQWELGADIFLLAHLGTPAIAAGGARRHLNDNATKGCRILSQVGRTEDVPLIWEATHPTEPKASENWYEQSSLGWLPIIRLTNDPSAKVEPK